MSSLSSAGATPAAFPSDEILWYNNGQWGALGYGVPNFFGFTTSLNQTIVHIVQTVGRNFFAIMQSPDCDLRTPPSINSIIKICKTIVRLRGILSGRALTPGTPKMEGAHATPSPMPFLVYPCPYFQVRNQWLQEYGGLAMGSLSEAMQHTENRVPLEITTTFAGLIGQYFQRILLRVATELLGIDAVTASDPAFTPTAAQLAAYNPANFFTSTEMVDTTAPVSLVPPGNNAALQVLANGIPASQLVGLMSWNGSGALSNPVPAGGTTPAATATGAFVTPPSP